MKPFVSLSSINKQKLNAMTSKQFERALDFIKDNQENTMAIQDFLEQLLVEANDDMIKAALDNTEDFLNILNADK
jgi:DNA-binding phage protein